MASRVVFKYALTRPITRVAMPIGARVLDVQTQNNVPTIWALCDPDATHEPREFIAFGTGHTIADPVLEYVGTAHGVAGDLVFHIFERPLR